MPMLDMPLDKLKVYEGTNPRPADFDEFWDRSLEEMRAIDPKAELVPSEFECSFADCFDLYFTSTFDSRIHAKLVKPKKIDGACPAILHFHGYSGKSDSWVNLLPYAAEGMIAAALDCRGQAGESVDGCVVSGNTLEGFITKGLLDEPEKMYYRNAFLDTAMLARVVADMPEVDDERMGATGGSQGGGLTLACAALEPRIKKAAASFPFLSDYKRTWDMDLDVHAYKDLRAFFRQKDPRHEKEEHFFTKLGYADVQFLAPRIKAEVLMFSGLLDNICPPSTHFAVYNKITSKKNVKIYPDFGHETLPDSNEMIFEFLRTL